MSSIFADWLSSRSFVLLDGAVGTELSLRGADLHGHVDETDVHDDYWTGRALLTAPEVVRAVHEDYLLAGADVITTNTFRTNPRTVAKLDLAPEVTADRLTRTAVLLAREARQMRRSSSLLGGSIGPVGSCYSPEEAPGDDELAIEHEATIASLVAGGVDLMLPETMNSGREASIVARQIARTGMPFIVAFTLRADGRLHSGETLSAAVDRVAVTGPLGILLNHCQPREMDEGLHELSQALAGSEVLWGARPHLGKPTVENGWTEPGNLSISEFSQLARRWLDAGSRILGGCCGTTPAHIAALAELRAVRGSEAASLRQGGEGRG